MSRRRSRRAPAEPTRSALPWQVRPPPTPVLDQAGGLGGSRVPGCERVAPVAAARRPRPARARATPPGQPRWKRRRAGRSARSGPRRPARARPPARVATTGNPTANASSTTLGKPSAGDGKTKTSAAARRSRYVTRSGEVTHPRDPVAGPRRIGDLAQPRAIRARRRRRRASADDRRSTASSSGLEPLSARPADPPTRGGSSPGSAGGQGRAAGSRSSDGSTRLATTPSPSTTPSPTTSRRPPRPTSRPTAS